MENNVLRRNVLFRIIFAFILIILLAVVLFYISKSTSFQFFGELVNHIDTDQKQIAITFDDGPTENTQKILGALEKLDIKATFFLCGIGIDERPEDAEAISAAGHGIGNHSYSHKRMLLVSYSFCQDEIERTDALIRAAGYRGEIYFRPPYFKKLFTLPLYLSNNDRVTVLADVDAESALGTDATAQDYADYVLQNTKPGSIILMHPMYNPDIMLEAVTLIVTELRNQGYSFVTIEELLSD